MIQVYHVFIVQVTVFMDRMTSYPHWYITPLPKDQVPVGHSLTGYATAFDFLYERFSPDEQQRYVAKLMEVTSHMSGCISKKTGGWPRQHIHNHAPSNVLATLLGAMVLKEHYPKQGKRW